MSQCMTPVYGKALRVTRLDACGRVDYGTCATVTTAGFTTVSYSMETDEGEEISVSNAAGDSCVDIPGRPRLKWVNIEVEFCQVDIDLFLMMFPTWAAELDGAGASAGFRVSTAATSDVGVAIELWTDLVGTSVCEDESAQGAWGYLLLPRVTNAILGDLEVTNSNVTFSITASTIASPLWGVGPYNVILDAEDAPSPLLVAMGAKEPMLFRSTTVAPPTAECGCKPLVAGTTGALTLTATVDTADPMTFAFTTTGGFLSDPVVYDFGDGTDTVSVDNHRGTTATVHTYTDAGTDTATATSGSSTDTVPVTPAEA